MLSNLYIMKYQSQLFNSGWFYPVRSSQSIKIAIDLSIDKSIKIGKSDLIDIDRINQLAEINDTLVSFINSFQFLLISSIYIRRYICSSKVKTSTEFMQTANLLTIDLQLRVEGSNIYHCFVYQTFIIFK